MHDEAQSTPRCEDHPAHARRLIAAALEAADPARALAQHWDPSLDNEPCVLLAVGKASIPMAREALSRLKHVRRALVTAPPDQVESARLNAAVLPCDHPFPTQRNVDAARQAAALVSGVQPDESLIVLISGGGSAHLTLPAQGLTVEDLAAATRLLQTSGATITELNCVRKHCELLKGGRLAALCPGRRVVSFVLSDVIGDKLDVIASGPTSPDPTTYADAVAVLEHHRIGRSCPAVLAHLKRGMAGELPETPKARDPIFARVSHTIVASNRLVVDAVCEAATALGFTIALAERGREGEAAGFGEWLGATTYALQKLPRTSAAVIGGETTVTVGDSRGIGGPSQETALAWAEVADALELSNCVLLTFSTDGRDGPTDAAGAIVTPDLFARARASGLDPAAALREHDSHTLLDRLGALIRVPPTGTNLNHVAVILTYPG